MAISLEKGQRMTEYYFIGGDNEEYGPYSVDQMKRLVGENRLNANSNVRIPKGDWKPASTYPELGLQTGPAGVPVHGYQQKALNPQAVQKMANGPAIFMMVLSGISIPFVLLGLVFSVLGGSAGFLDNLPSETREQLMLQGGAGIVQYSLSLIANIFILIGAIKMKNLRSYGLAVAASILSILFHCGCCCLGLGAGIWALVILSKPEVKAAFAQNKMMR